MKKIRKKRQIQMMAAVLVCGILVTACGKQGGNNTDGNAAASDARHADTTAAQNEKMTQMSYQALRTQERR